MFKDQYHGQMVDSITTVTHFSYKITLIFVIFVIDCDIELNLCLKAYSILKNYKPFGLGLFHAEKYLNLLVFLAIGVGGCIFPVSLIIIFSKMTQILKNKLIK